MDGRKIKQMLDRMGVKQRALADKMGCSPQSINAVLSAKDVRSNTIERIAEALGVGMDYFYPTENNTHQTENIKAKPYYGSLPVSAGRVIQYPDILVQSATGTINIPQTHGAEMFFPVIGMSMKPSIDEGEIIGVAHVDCYETTNADRIYMIVTRDGERMIKRILKYDKESGLVILGSDNPQYPNTELSVDMIMDIYKVMFHMKIETL